MLMSPFACAFAAYPLYNVTFLANKTCWPARLSVQCCRYATKTHIRSSGAASVREAGTSCGHAVQTTSGPRSYVRGSFR